MAFSYDKNDIFVWPAGWISIRSICGDQKKRKRNSHALCILDFHRNYYDNDNQRFGVFAFSEFLNYFQGSIEGRFAQIFD